MLMSAGATIAGRFEMLAQAGTGGMSTVFRARDRQTGRMVAVKVLKLDRPFDLARFTREATLLSSVRHPNVVDYVAHGEAEGIHFLVQEWVDGITLSTQLGTLGTTAREAVAIGIGVAGALSAVHALGVVHRDIKPSNLILVGGEPERVKLVDFGIARMANDAGVLTRTGVIIGTPAYMSPEQARGSVAIEPAADVWSLGCVLFEALTGRSAFTGKTHVAIRAKVLLGAPPALEPLCPEAPIALVDLMSDMLTKDTRIRPHNGAALLARLQALPPVDEGPRRRYGAPQVPTRSAAPRANGSDKSAAPSSFVMFNALVPAAGSVAPVDGSRLAEIARRHNMDLHVFDDGSAVLASQSEGREGAIEAAHAAIEVQRDIPAGAVSVFGRGGDNDSLENAIDRGSVLAERAAMTELFGDIVDDQSPAIYLDDTIADLIDTSIPVDHTPDGPVVRGDRRGR
jgi:serine/threonine protein kinase